VEVRKSTLCLGALSISTSRGHANFGGNGIKNSLAGNFYYWGLPSNNLAIIKGRRYPALFYAPNADLSIERRRMSIYNLSLRITRLDNVNTNYGIHYDEVSRLSGA